MKKTIGSLALSMITVLAFSSAGIASPSQTSIKLQGEIAPDACDIAVNQASSIKLDLYAWSQRDPRQVNIPLPLKNLTLMIRCQGATAFAIRPRDIAPNAGNVRLAGHSPRDIFSLGLTSRGQPIGGYLAQIDPARSQVDGQPISHLLASDNNGVNWRIAGQPRLSSTGELIYSWGKQSMPDSARQVVINIILQPFLFEFSPLDAVKIDGMTTFEIVYL